MLHGPVCLLPPLGPPAPAHAIARGARHRSRTAFLPAFPLSSLADDVALVNSTVFSTGHYWRRDDRVRLQIPRERRVTTLLGASLPEKLKQNGATQQHHRDVGHGLPQRTDLVEWPFLKSTRAKVAKVPEVEKLKKLKSGRSCQAVQLPTRFQYAYRKALRARAAAAVGGYRDRCV